MSPTSETAAVRLAVAGLALAEGLWLAFLARLGIGVCGLLL